MKNKVYRVVVGPEDDTVVLCDKCAKEQEGDGALLEDLADSTIPCVDCGESTEPLLRFID